jgi:hypothetical protein
MVMAGERLLDVPSLRTARFPIPAVSATGEAAVVSGTIAECFDISISTNHHPPLLGGLNPIPAPARPDWGEAVDE